MSSNSTTYFDDLKKINKSGQEVEALTTLTLNTKIYLEFSFSCIVLASLGVANQSHAYATVIKEVVVKIVLALTRAPSPYTVYVFPFLDLESPVFLYSGKVSSLFINYHITIILLFHSLKFELEYVKPTL